MKKVKLGNPFGMTLLFAVIIFCSAVLNIFLVGLILYALVHAGVVEMAVELRALITRTLPVIGAVSLATGAVVSVAASLIPLKPIRQLMDSMDKLAAGEFDTRISAGKVMRRYPAFVQLAESFNSMAEQLQSTEILRGDFINNFSHEFKTPIVSIAGFAKLLKQDNADEKKRQEYLNIIEEESMRLSYMATNVLSLSKVENQTALTDVSSYNLSEQIRSCILMLEKQWSKKEISFSLLFDEHRIQASEDLMREVWINLLHNAIKYSPYLGEIKVEIDPRPERVQVHITNYGITIPKQKQERVFDKFYQVDESHAGEGNGVGLAIVQKIVQLHRGSVSVYSEEDVTAFTVSLPQQQ